MKHSDSIANLAASLVAAQSELRAISKDSTNPDFRSAYVSLDKIIETVRPILAANGLALVQGATQPDYDGNGRLAAMLVETMLVHSSGEWLCNSAIMPVVGRMLKGGGRADPDPQSGGSALTYGRRYGVAALLCLATDEDDDGNRAIAQQNGRRDAGVKSAERGAGTAPTGSASQGQATHSARQQPAPASQPGKPGKIGDAIAPAWANDKDVTLTGEGVWLIKGVSLEDMDASALKVTRVVAEKRGYGPLVAACNKRLTDLSLGVGR